MKTKICESCREEIEAKHDPRLERKVLYLLLVFAAANAFVILSAIWYWTS
jgi:hypothetical protein